MERAARGQRRRSPGCFRDRGRRRWRRAGRWTPRLWPSAHQAAPPSRHGCAVGGQVDDHHQSGGLGAQSAPRSSILTARGRSKPTCHPKSLRGQLRSARQRRRIGHHRHGCLKVSNSTAATTRPVLKLISRPNDKLSVRRPASACQACTTGGAARSADWLSPPRGQVGWHQYP